MLNKGQGKQKRNVNLPSKFLAVADANIIDMASVIRSIGLEYGRHDLGDLFTDFGCRLWLTIICGSSEVKAFGNKWFMFEETIEVVSIFKIIISA